MPARALRPLAATLAATAAFGGLALAGAPSAVAAPGDNGDIKVHKVGTPYGDLNDEARVCKFYLAAFNFDILDEVTWEITPQPPRPEVPSLNGRVALNTGMGHSSTLSLPEGQYRVTWTFPGAAATGKQKVFTVASRPFLAHRGTRTNKRSTPDTPDPPHRSSTTARKPRRERGSEGAEGRRRTSAPDHRGRRGTAQVGVPPGSRWRWAATTR
ncbi:hypothetical protein ACWDNT_12735 [Streptomyces sp. NPDC000963]